MFLFGCSRGTSDDAEDGLSEVDLSDIADQSELISSDDIPVEPQAGRFPICSADAIDSGAGWGWENEQSCQWPGAFAAFVAPPECGSGASDSGYGWGWEADGSCKWASPEAARASRPECTANAQNSGNGWGWENGESCLWGDSTLPDSQVVAESSVVSAPVITPPIVNTPVITPPANDTPVASPPANNTPPVNNTPPAVIAPVEPVQQISSNDPVTVARPVFLGAPGYIQGSPICLTDASDGNNDGFGFENNRTCLVVEGTTATSDNPMLNTRWCEPWAEISYGDYVLQNNTWNQSEVYANYWHQCIELGGDESQYVAKWDYNWLDKTRGNEFSVKSYPQVYYGRKTRYSTSGTPEELGLPADIFRLPQFKVRYKYSETGNPERNVALESFFHYSCEAEEWNKHFEMMVWVGVPEIRTAGPQVAEAIIDGVGWDVHVNPSLDWGYVAFVAQEPSEEGWLDWNKFVEWTRFNGPAFGVPRIQSNTCMGAIEIGTETFWGQGTFTLEEFSVFRQ